MNNICRYFDKLLFVVCFLGYVGEFICPSIYTVIIFRIHMSGVLLYMSVGYPVPQDQKRLDHHKGPFLDQGMQFCIARAVCAYDDLPCG